ncbi:alpha/beta fold hydrolase [Bauldia sp.]|uniref:alpha/beta fold hydrolase n=1 Tax=Bauldia sp. TaxID=2575872 RepID=UPI003BAAEBB7
MSEVVTTDGVRLRASHWRPSRRRPRGTVCVLQGRSECIEKYFEVVEDLRRRGFAVATFDWRGQGGSERRLRNRRKGHIDSFVEYDRDFDGFMEQVVLPDCPPPHFGIGHSTGGLVALRAAKAGRARFDRMVLAAPLVGFAVRPSRQRLFLAGSAIMTALGLGEVVVPRPNARWIEEGRFDGNPLTSDPDRFARAVAIYREVPEIAVGPATFGWLYAALQAMSLVNQPDFATGVDVPALVLLGTLDSVVSLAAVEQLATELRAGALSIIPGARHELMMERDELREQFWAAFDAFVPGS